MDFRCFPLSFLFKRGNKRKIIGCHVETVRGLGDHLGLAPGQIIGQADVAVQIVVAEFHRVFDVTPVFESLSVFDAGDPAFQSRLVPLVACVLDKQSS